MSDGVKASGSDIERLKRARLAELVRAGMSLARAARDVSISLKTATAWLREENS